MQNKLVVSEIKSIVTKSLCCPDTEIKKTRVVFASNGNAPTKIMKHFAATRQELISYKALIKRSGRGRDMEFKRIGTVASNSRLLQGAQAVGSAITPGNLSAVRSPIRSSLTRAITPGIPGIPGRGRGGDGYSRCPEGYQYGGRFTDNRFSTCGQKLFALPGPLGAAIGLIRRLIRQETPSVTTTGTVLGAGNYAEGNVSSRAPQIPRVSLSNPARARAEIQKLVKPLGAVDQAASRMVRRDGFVLEPVVPPSVLRTIPDNRDMEGATYMMSISSPDLIGKDELGLLSNTGVQSLKYILPGGSELTLEKRRPLTVGERRKLGRTVNSAIESSNSKDPASRLKMVAMETGDGIGYSEKFVGIKNPNEIGKDGRQRWASMAFAKRNIKPRNTEEVDVPAAEEAAPTPQAAQEIGGKITTVADAVAHIARGGSLSQISPEILQQALAKANGIKRDRISDSRFMMTLPNGDKYIENVKPSKYEALGQRFASEVQQHLGLESPAISFIGIGDSRRYLVESPEIALKGGKVNDDATFRSSPWQEVSRLMIADVLTDVQNRNPGSVEIVDSNNRQKIVPMVNDGAGLVELSKISIRERTEQSLNDLLSPTQSQLYAQYFRELRESQRAQQLKFIATLIQRAREFNFSNFKSKLYNDGKLTDGEKIHLNILQKLYEQRLNQLVTQNEVFNEIVSGKK
jgi:hypothetical protein